MSDLRIIIAPDSLKNCMSQACAAISMKRGIATLLDSEGRLRGTDTHVSIITLPVSDGGEGFAECISACLPREPERHTATVRGPLGKRVCASYFIDRDSATAYLDLASAAGIQLVPAAERDPMATSTYGFGELIRHSFDSGARRVVAGLGGSATTDAGLGALQALGLKVFGDDGQPINGPVTGALLAKVTGFDTSGLAGIRGRIVMATDVTSPLYGPTGAACVFAPQKGASPSMVSALDKGLRHVGSLLDSTAGRAVSAEQGAGAAGGCGAGFAALAGAEIGSGAEIIIKESGLDGMLHDATLLLTAEGSADRQTLDGKIACRLMRHASAQGVPVELLAGRVADRSALLEAGFWRVTDINEGKHGGNPLDPATAAARLARAAAMAASRLISR